MFSSFFALMLRSTRRGGAGHLPPMPCSSAGNTGADVADHGSGDLDVAVHLLRFDVDLDECLRSGLAPGLAFAVRQKPVEACADQHDDIGILQHRRARGAGTLRMGVGQKPLGHAHRQKRNAALLHQRANVVVGLRVSRTFAENDQRTLSALENIERARDRRRRGYLRRRRVDNLDSDLAPASASITCAKSLAGRSR